MIDKSGHSDRKHFVTAARSKADYRHRRFLISKTVEAWYRAAPKQARAMMNYLNEVTKVEHSSGKWKSGKGYCSLRLPRDLFISLRKVFQRFGKDLEPFGTTDDDVKILYEEFPKLMPTGARRRARKGR